MLVRLTEVCANGAVTSPNTYILRDVFVNPEHVIMIREEKRIKELNERGVLTEGLDINHRFSKITINRGQTGTEIIVVGAPDVVEIKLQNNSKQVLRG
mgnify:CR=1 FL=1|jgi:hypothetical protein|tara:strand:- start:139 stop:432 length:294 start_codon:yes stop_codon:yes gene_type:complete